MSASLQPSATVVLLREEAGTLGVLLARRNRGLSFAPGCWVFPGGSVTRADGLTAVEAAGHGLSPAYARAAARELREETALVVEPEQLEPFAEWITPVQFERRFRTVFFLASHPGGEARPDGREMVSVELLSVSEALARQRAGYLVMMPPTFVTLAQLEGARSLGEARAKLLAGRSEGDVVARYRPVLVKTAQGTCALYEGDAHYPGSAQTAPTSRHRLWTQPGAWRYERVP